MHGAGTHRSPAHVGLWCVPSLDHSYSTPPQRVSDGVWTSPRGSAITVVLLLLPAPSLSILCMMPRRWALWSSCSSCFLRWHPPHVPACVFISRVAQAAPFLFHEPPFETHITWHWLGGRSFSSPRWPGCSLRVGKGRTLMIQLHHDCWGKSGLSTSAWLSFTLSGPPYGWQGGGPSPANFPALSANIPANPWPLPVLCFTGLLAVPLPTPLPANTLFGEGPGLTVSPYGYPPLLHY